jgi:hypothetical protein
MAKKGTQPLAGVYSSAVPFDLWQASKGSVELAQPGRAFAAESYVTPALDIVETKQQAPCRVQNNKAAGRPVAQRMGGAQTGCKDSL